MKVIITANPLQNFITKPPLVTNLTALLEIMMNKLDAIDTKEKGYPRLFSYKIRLVREEE